MEREFKKFIHCKLQWEGFHFWADAPDEEAFLRSPHRHLFKAEIKLEVQHDDRELEFFAVLKRLENRTGFFFMSSTPQPASCELMAEVICDQLLEWYGRDRECSVTVFEDGENGGGVEWTPTS